MAAPALTERNKRRAAAKARSRATTKAVKVSLAAQADACGAALPDGEVQPDGTALPGDTACAGGEGLPDGEALPDGTALAGCEALPDREALPDGKVPVTGGAPMKDTARPKGEGLEYGELSVPAAVWGRQQTARDAQGSAVSWTSDFGMHVSDQRDDTRSPLLVAAFDCAQRMLDARRADAAALAAAAHRPSVVTDAEREAAAL